MVLIFGRQSDACARLTHQYFCQGGMRAMFIPDVDLLSTAGLNWSLAHPAAGSTLTLPSSRIQLSDVSGVLARMRFPLPLEGDLSAEDRQYIQDELRATILGWLNSLDCRVVNRPTAGVSRWFLLAPLRESRWVAQSGLKLAKTLVTSSHQAGIRFYEECGQIALLGSPSGQQSWRLIRGGTGAERLSALLTRQPVCLQEVPEGQWLQVFTVGDRAFGIAAAIDRMAEDADGGRLPAVELPPGLEESCCWLARALGLEFSQIDLLQTAGGEVYCLEVCAFPTYERCAEPVQAQITAALAHLLMGERREGRDTGLRRAGGCGDRLCLLAAGQPEP